MGVIFDLDQTLIDSVKAEQFRKERRWEEVYKIIHELKPYDGASELISYLKRNKVPICIVTSTPETYCCRVIKHWKWDIDAIVCYHHTANKKPHPEPVLLGVKKLKRKASQIAAVGDDANDIIAYNRAGVYSIAVSWGKSSNEQLYSVSPNKIARDMYELKDLLVNYLKINNSKYY